jgi:hypothetical protein
LQRTEALVVGALLIGLPDPLEDVRPVLKVFWDAHEICGRERSIEARKGPSAAREGRRERRR